MPLQITSIRTILILTILLLATAVRLHLLGAQSLWNDEGNSYVQATRSFIEIADNAGRDIHPPGYYWALAAWRAPTGDTEFALRSLSAFASILSVAFGYALGRRLYGNVAGLAAALFTALNTFSIFYAQETRMYSPLALWAAASMWAFAGFVRRPSRKWALLLALFNLGGMWTQYVYPLVMVAQGLLLALWLFWRYFDDRDFEQIKRPLSYYVAANLLTIALYLPWLPTALRQVRAWPNTGQAIPLDEALEVILGWFTFGNTYIANDFGALVYLPALIFLLAGLAPLRNSGRLPGWQRMVLPVVWALLMVGVFLALGLFRFANLKLLLPAQIAFAVWMGRGVWVLYSWRVRDRSVVQLFPRIAVVAGVGWLAFNLSAGLDPLYNDAAFQRADYRRIVADLDATLRPGDAIILDAPGQEEVFGYYYGATAPVFPLPRGLGGDDAETLAAVDAIIADHERVFVVFWGEAERDPNRVVETTLDMATFEIGDQWYGDVRLARYVTPADLAATQTSGAQFGPAITLARYALSAEALQPGDVLQLRLDWLAAATLDTRYKVTVQLLNSSGALAAQRDSEPGGGLALTTTWTPGDTIRDNHGLPLPDDLAPGDYQLIVGLYDIDDPAARLPVGESDMLSLGIVRVG